MSNDMNTYEITITSESIAPPEPRIGPGMILERGRERFVITETVVYFDSKVHWRTRSMVRYRRLPMCEYPSIGKTFKYEEPTIRAMLLSGFRVIRQADPLPDRSGEKP